jgi:hypothetical protein
LLTEMVLPEPHSRAGAACAVQMLLNLPSSLRSL